MPRRRIGSLSASSQRSSLLASAEPFGACRACAARPGVPDGLPDEPLEELTPELPYPAHWVGEALHGHDRRARCGVDDDLFLAVGDTLRVDPDDTVVDAALLDDPRSDFGIPVEATGVRDLDAARGGHVAPQEPRDCHPNGPDVRFHVRLRSDEKIAIALDLAGEVAKHLAAALQLQPA